MATLTAQPSIVLQVVTRIAQMVSHGHHAAHHSRHAGTVGTGNTLLVAPMAQRGNGKHRASAA